jgi:hypothetical protein
VLEAAEIGQAAGGTGASPLPARSLLVADNVSCRIFMIRTTAVGFEPVKEMPGASAVVPPGAAA